MGPSGSGKSSLLRCIAGLWNFSGKIRRPIKLGKNGIFYLPQKPYLPYGTLIDQIIYPNIVTDKDTSELVNFLRFANIEYLYKQRGFTEILKWDEILSPGEQQRLMFARLFFHNPLFAILDEATSALDSNNELNLYKKCSELGITLISVGHRESLKQFHQRLLNLNGDGTYVLSDIINEGTEEGVTDKWEIIESNKGTLQLFNTELFEEDLEVSKSPSFSARNFFSQLWRLWKLAHGQWCCSKNTGFLIIFVLTAVLSSVFLGLLPFTLRKLSDTIINKQVSDFWSWSLYALSGYFYGYLQHVKFVVIQLVIYP